MEVKKIINALPESNGYYEWMTAREYLEFFAKLYGEEPSRQKIDGLLEAVGLHEKEGYIIRGYSRGMKQRLGMTLVKRIVSVHKIF
jgi:ABC-type multidrug transport system, ATPase component